MKNRYRLISRGNRGGALYWVDRSTGKRISLGACSRDEAKQIVLAKNRALRQPTLNLQIARSNAASKVSFLLATTPLEPYRIQRRSSAEAAECSTVPAGDNPLTQERR